MDLNVYTRANSEYHIEEDYKAGLQSFAVIRNFFNDVLENIADIKEKLHVFNVAHRDKNINEFADLKKIKNKINDIIRDKRYQDVENIKIAGLAGLSSLSLAASELPLLVKLVNETTLPGLAEVDRILAEFISDKDFRKSYKFRYGSKVDMLLENKYKVDSKLSLFIDISNIQDYLPINKIVPNLETLNTVFAGLYNAAEQTNVAELVKINELVDVISAKMDIIDEIIKTDTDSFSKTSLQGVADLLSGFSTQIKLHSLVYYITGEIIKIYINTVEAVKESKH